MEAMDAINAPKPNHREGNWIEKRVANFFSPAGMLVLFTMCNFLNYTDRGVIPGAYEQIGAFSRYSTKSDEEDTLLGSLQSAFIVGYALASLVIGNLVHRFPPFKLMSMGLFVWCLAVLLCAVSPAYWVLIIGRVLSGCGEASFQCVVPPFIDDNAPKEKRSLWLSIFFAMIPVGTASGLAFGGAMGPTGENGWRYAFAIEAVVMLPIAIVTFFLPYHRQGEEVRKETPDEEVVPITPDYRYGREDDGDEDGLRGLEDQHSEEAPLTIWQELILVLKQPTYVTVVLGYAAYTAVVAGLSNFGPTFLQGLGLVQSETVASTSMGVLVVFTGLLGTIGGGVTLDWLVTRANKRQAARLGIENIEAKDDEEQATRLRILDTKFNQAVLFSACTTFVGFLIMLAAPFMTSSLGLFFFALGVGSLVLFLSTAAVTVAIMGSVAPENRAFAIGLGTVVTHGLGDVPSPAIIGQLADRLSPIPPPHSGEHRSKHGLQITLFLTILWLIWCVIFWFLAYVYGRQRESNHIKRRQYAELGGPDSIAQPSWTLTCSNITQALPIEDQDQDTPDSIDNAPLLSAEPEL